MKQNETILQFIERTILHKPKVRSFYEDVQPFQFIEMSYVLVSNKQSLKLKEKVNVKP